MNATEATSVREAFGALARAVPQLVASHATADGGYARLMATDGSQSDVYGLADAVGVLWSANALPDAERRAELVTLLRHCGSVDGGFSDPSHGRLHTTALSYGSLALLGAARPATIPFLNHLWDPTAVVEFLDGRDWENPWLASHDVAGLAAIGATTELAGPAWFDAYFAWLDDNVDPARVRPGEWWGFGGPLNTL